MLDIPIITPTVFSQFSNIVAGSSTRLGGSSKPPFDSLNLGMSTGDDQAVVRKNREQLFQSVGFNTNQVAIMSQVHGNEVRIIEEAGPYEAIDGMVTSTKDILLCVGTADCAALLFADPEAEIIGACHAGWRGTHSKIAQETILKMEALGSEVTSIRCFISPCISVGNFEVGEEVATLFPEEFVVRLPKTKPHIDLKAYICSQLQEIGILQNHIEVEAHCTFSETDTFFSYRAENGKTGRMMSFIGMKTGT